MVRKKRVNKIEEGDYMTIEDRRLIVETLSEMCRKISIHADFSARSFCFAKTSLLFRNSDIHVA
jgi:hypothetical protein